MGQTIGSFMQQLTPWKIKKVTPLGLTSGQQSLVLKYNKLWDQDDVEAMAQAFFNQLADARIIETILGADRVCYRFDYLSQYFILQYETYTSSCWIESEDHQGHEQLSQLAQYLMINN
jgi:hypothetical protein